MSTMYELLQENSGDFTSHELAVLSDWANDMNRATPNPDWKRAYSLIREGADLLLRRRARSSAGAGQLRYEDEPEGLNHQTYVSTAAVALVDNCDGTIEAVRP